MPSILHVLSSCAQRHLYLYWYINYFCCFKFYGHRILVIIIVEHIASSYCSCSYQKLPASRQPPFLLSLVLVTFMFARNEVVLLQNGGLYYLFTTLSQLKNVFPSVP